MALFKQVDGVKIPLTPSEETTVLAERATETERRPMDNWKVEMARSDGILPRWGEDILDGMDKSGVAQITLDRLQTKKDLRATKP